MKGIRLVVVAIALTMMAGGAAADTNTLTVSANVVGTCKFSSAASTLGFGDLDPSAGTNKNVTTSTEYWCTKGVLPSSATAGDGLNLSGGKRRMAGPGGDFIPYDLSLTADPSPGAGPGTPRTLTIAGGVLGTDYTGKTAGGYSDTVILTINP